MDRFVNIHVHTHYSNNNMYDSTATVEAVVKRVKELGQTAFAITDHGTVSGLIDGYKEAKKNDLHFVFGSEFYFVPEVGIKNRDSWHLVLIAKDNEGYKNLLKLTTLAHQNFYYKPRVDWDMLKAHSKGLIATSACLGGVLNMRNEGAWDQDASTYRLEQFLDIFGGDFYIELHTNQMKDQVAHNIAMIDMAEKFGVPLIACVDSHYVREDQYNVHKAWVGIGDNDERGYYSTNDYFLMSSKQVHDRLMYLPQDCVSKAIKNTSTLADRCHVEIDFKSKHYPHFPVPEGMTHLDRMKEICREGWKKKIIPHVPKEQWQLYGDRVNEEFDVLQKCDYVEYMLIVHDMLDWCRNRANPKIMTGIGRGSVGGSLVAYLMDITKIDPIKTDLLFSRFTHTERISPPDIDSDIEKARREDVIEYVRQKYNGDVYHVRTFSYMGARGALKRAGQALGLPHDQINKLSKTVNPISDKYKDQVDALEEIRDKANGDLIDLAKELVHVIQGYSTHASAIILFPADPTNWVAIERNPGDSYVVSYKYGDVEAQGLLKIDALGLKTLDVIHSTLNLIGNKANGFDIEHLPDNDKLTFDMLHEGKTAGCFQIEGQGMTNLVKNIKPSQYFDMIPLVALYRPGCLQAGMVEVFTKRRNGEEEVEYLDPKMKAALEDTYGVILYQEQIQKLANIMAGYSMGEADLLRRAVGKKKPEEMAVIIPEFVKRGVECGNSEETMKKLAELIEYFAGYGFNKSHSASYGYISYQTAYLKAHYPVEFMTSLLNVYMDSPQEDIVPYINEIKAMGIKILPPCVNRSEGNWTIEKQSDGTKAVRIGLAYLKGVGKVEYPRPVSSIGDLREAKVNKGKIEAMIKAGALDCIGNRADLLVELWEVEETLKSIDEKIAHAKNRIDELCSDIEKTKPTTKKYTQLQQQLANREKDVEKLNKKKVEVFGLQKTLNSYSDPIGEREVLGFSFTDILDCYDLSCAKEPNIESKIEHIIGAEVVKFKKHMQKNGKPMAFITARTRSKTVDLVMFNSSYRILEEGRVYLISIRENKVTDAMEARRAG